MGNKEEITNLIGRKGSKMTVKSNVKTLALKVYDEQIPDGWEKLKERIKELKKAEYQCLGIKHDEDVLGDDFFEPSTEKPHQRTGNGHPVNKIPGCGIPERGQGVSPCDAYLSVASVAKTTFRYKELHHKRSL